MKLFIPELGTKLTLTQPWDFKLYNEDRNSSLLKAWDLYNDPEFDAACDAVRNNPRYDWARKDSNERMSYFLGDYNWDVTLDTGTELVVDRIYIRKGLSDWSSMTFRITETTDPDLAKQKKRRFWAKLNDCNQIECTIEEAG
jgi:hypothetical protein